MTQERVTRQELREMSVGQMRIFNLTDKKKLASARVTCATLKNEEGKEYITKIDYQAIAIVITRIK